MEKQRLNIEGMDCTNCAMTIKKVMEKQGAQDVSVSFTTGEAAFVWDKKDLSPVIESINKLGYHVLERNKEKNAKFFNLKTLLIICSVFTAPLLLHMFAPEDSILNNPYFQLVLSTPVFIIGFIHFGKSAWGSVKVLLPNMDVLIFIGASSAYFYSLIGTFILSGGHHHKYLFFETSASIITLVLLGNWIEHLAVKRTTGAIEELSKLQKVKAKVFNGLLSKEPFTLKNADELKIGDIVLVSEGEQIPIDALISVGECWIDESMISGESVPVLKKVGDQVLGGTLCQQGNVKIKVNRIGKDTTLQQIIQLVKSAQENQPEIQRLGDRVSAIFVPVVLGISLLTFLITYFFTDNGMEVSVMNSIAVLVISCPCAMGLATPTAVMVGVGKAAKQGILIRGGNTIEMLSEVKYMVFDKTGTLTTGEFKIKNIRVFNGASQDLIHNILFSLESHSAHPIAKSICKELKLTSTLLSFQQITEIKGVGITGTFDNKEYEIVAGSQAGEIDVLENDIIIASVKIEDELKSDVAQTMTWLKNKGIEPVLLSGDKKEKCEMLAKEIGISLIYAEQKPDDKLRVIEELSAKGKVAMVGDGINDAPALAKAYVGISLGAATDVAKQSAQVILLNNTSLHQITEVVALCKITLKTIKQNLFWALFYNVLAIPVAAFGFLMPIFAALAMAFSDVIVIGNSLRIKAKTLN
ncbi:MAG: cation-translocating P-type ATPase [Bacteroidetes bacterium]|nr:cation-translocating P-type ATPase [Bacteroidota bacterium]